MSWLKSQQKRKKLTLTVVYVLLILISMVNLSPFFWMISTSFKQPDEIFLTIPKLLPRSFSFSNYVGIWNDSYFSYYLKNSLIVALLNMLIGTLVSVFAGYGISRFNFKGRFLFSIVLIIVQIFPGMLLAIPLFTIMNKLRLIDTYWALLIAYSTFTLPFCTWMLKGYFDTIPVSLEEAARIEGCGRLQILFRIILPLALPGVVAVAMFAFVLAWQEYLFALTLTRSEEMRTITVGIAMMQGEHGRINWGQIMAGSIIACLPGVIVFLLMEKYLVQGFTMGAVKE
ncbi:carbohydrate ABC transporter permease [Anaerocellum diazotrophicum]|uniref:ABC transporter permease n=1 Tax=Caldicellulosiruptor diazotrophicus TaxID=2806205 RepID=A0ABM7NJA2_9FIRM|nr:carbohydrate ABC transporter permease [Caldicellulosiruptor diazotrophicus]BCS80186.1 ABC transporter permease [Caldicellulosiruptor diazotrophicus]